MPTYLMRCANCGDEWEFRVPVERRDHYTRMCAQCDEIGVERVITPSALIGDTVVKVQK